MKQLIAEIRGSRHAAAGASGMVLAGKVRFGAGLAITGGGAAVFLSDLIARVTAWV